MKVHIELDPELKEESVVILCRELSPEVLALQRSLQQGGFSEGHGERTILLKQAIPETQGRGGLTEWVEKEFYIPLADILFFETENKVVQAHTRKEIYQTEQKLYELEEWLPGSFMRISKSSIVNLREIYAITKNLSGASRIEFANTHKSVYASRSFYRSLTERLRHI